MRLLIQLRWIAVAGQVLTIGFVEWGLGIALPLWPMGTVIAGLVTLNLVSLVWLRGGWRVSAAAIMLALLLDVLALTTQLALSGGITNPFTTLFLLQVTLAAVLLGRRASWALVALTSLSFLALARFHLPLEVPPGADLFTLHLIGLFLGLTIDAVLVTAFVTRINSNLRNRDARLAELRQQQAEEDHIVRMGLLASGAAHELGTPLSSISVILGDWRRMPRIAEDPELAAEVAQLEKAVARCKAIVTGTLMSAGEARGEAPRLTSVHALVEEIAEDWAAARGFPGLRLANRFGEDMRIVSDETLKQVVMNVLDNALEASPDWVGLDVAREGGALVLTVRDRGPGFGAERLADFGRPYRSTKGRKGSGLGLFLVVNAIRKLGGGVSAADRAGGGAEICLRLPLATLTLAEDGAADVRAGQGVG